MDERGWGECDFIFVSGDAYVDHPSFGAPLICRVLEDEGYKVGIIPQPAWTRGPGQNPSPPEGSYQAPSITTLGRPRLAFLAGAGNLDSMVAHYTAAKRKRSDDAYSPGGQAGFRPDRALLRYVEEIRRAYKQVPVIIGGIEASLRRFAHYDYWSDKVRRSVLLDSKADILVYGMGERAIMEIAQRLAQGEPIEEIDDVAGTCVRGQERPPKALELPSYETVKGGDPASLRAYAEHFMICRANGDPLKGRILAEPYDSDGPRQRWVIQNPPALPLDTAELDRIYELPFTRLSHPIYDGAGGIPALKEVQFSLVSSRGCFGGCSFCSITFHQGRAVQSRSKESLVREAQGLTALPGFKGYIHDVGGPTANFFSPPCDIQRAGGFCTHRECLFPAPCPELRPDHGPYLEALAALDRASPTIKKIFIRSGIRFDFIALDRQKGREFLETLCRSHVSGQLRVAPEHVSAQVLHAMGKTGGYAEFNREFTEINKALGLKQYLVPYLISGHPACGMEEARELERFLKGMGFIPDQVQDFYPTPGTLSTVMYRTGMDPRSGETLHVPGEKERRLQRELLRK